MKTRHTSLEMEPVESLIHLIRGQRVILDADLARVYGVPTRQLNQAIKRNSDRFPDDFAFQLEPQEIAALRSQFVISKGRGGRRYVPIAFTEHGAIMAANVLNSPRAVQMGVFVVRAFVKMREAIRLMINAKTQKRKDAARRSPNPIVLDCGGKRSATPLWKFCPQLKSGVVAVLCRRSPKSSRLSKILTDSVAKAGKMFTEGNSPHQAVNGGRVNKHFVFFAPSRLCAFALKPLLNPYELEADLGSQTRPNQHQTKSRQSLLTSALRGDHSEHFPYARSTDH